MNEYNHHRIIRRFVSDNRANHLSMDNDIEKIFLESSDFTDSISTDSIDIDLKFHKIESFKCEYFLFHFYYDITISNDTIVLSRNDEKTDKTDSSMNHCENLGDLSKKEFFSLINDRPRPLCDTTDMGNQSDNVAFLHAMGTDSESFGDSKKLFEEHLKKCFAEYLFVKDNKKALFLLGIAMHGIMDSFTPSHMNFQHYTKQNMAFHAQGDVIPIRSISVINSGEGVCEYNISQEEVKFVPGQYDHDSPEAQKLDKYVKGFDDDDHINDVEYKMLKIFLYLSKIHTKSGTAITEKKEIEKFWGRIKGKSLSQINKILEHYEYGEEAYIFSDKALDAMKNIYQYLSKKRKKCRKEYSYYKNNKDKNENILNTALKKWQDQYYDSELKRIREEHVNLGLYSEDINSRNFYIINEAACTPIGKKATQAIEFIDKIL